MVHDVSVVFFSLLSGQDAFFMTAPQTYLHQKVPEQEPLSCPVLACLLLGLFSEPPLRTPFQPPGFLEPLNFQALGSMVWDQGLGLGALGVDGSRQFQQ